MQKRYDIIKEISKELRKIKGLKSHSFGYCCSSDYDFYHPVKDTDEYVSCKLYKGGLNNEYRDGKFDVDKYMYWMWELKTTPLETVIATMRSVCDKYGVTVVDPASIQECIEIQFPDTIRR